MRWRVDRVETGRNGKFNSEPRSGHVTYLNGLEPSQKGAITIRIRAGWRSNLELTGSDSQERSIIDTIETKERSDTSRVESPSTDNQPELLITSQPPKRRKLPLKTPPAICPRSSASSLPLPNGRNGNIKSCSLFDAHTISVHTILRTRGKAMHPDFVLTSAPAIRDPPPP